MITMVKKTKDLHDWVMGKPKLHATQRELDAIEQEMLPPILRMSREEREAENLGAIGWENSPHFKEQKALVEHNLHHTPPFAPRPNCKICQEAGMV